jgi:hypothetical protein
VRVVPGVAVDILRAVLGVVKRGVLGPPQEVWLLVATSPVEFCKDTNGLAVLA